MPSWRPDTAKQRLRLGPDRYRCSCRDARTNAKCFAHSGVKRHSLRRYDTNSDSNGDCNDNGFCYPNGNAHRNG